MAAPVSSSRRRYFWCAVFSAAAPVAAAFLFVAIIDPWDGLPLSPPLPRVAVTGSTRHAFPMLARNQGFDSVVLGTSTTRLLKPSELNRHFDASFVNLSIDAATAYEETRLLGAFLQSHPSPKFVLLGLDHEWCDPRPERRLSGYAFPEWLYEASRWAGYAEILNAFTIQEAGSQLWALLGLKPARHARDGYADFGVREDQYDPARARAKIARDGVARTPDGPDGFVFSPLHRLPVALAAIPAETRKLLFFVPFALAYQGPEGSLTRAYRAACKRAVARIAAGVPNTTLVDFMISSPITREDSHYYDGMHYRPAVANRLVLSLVSVVSGAPPVPDGDWAIPD